MGVSNNQVANETTFNQSFISRNADSDTVGKIDLLEIGSPPVSDIQKQINSIVSFLGQTLGGAANQKPTWASSAAGDSADSVKTRADVLTALFALAGGHTHGGAEGLGGLIAATGLVDLIGALADPTAVTTSGLSYSPDKWITVNFVEGDGAPVVVPTGTQIAGLANFGILILIGAGNALTFTADSTLKLNGDRTLVEGTVLAVMQIGSEIYELFYNGIGGL